MGGVYKPVALIHQCPRYHGYYRFRVNDPELQGTSPTRSKVNVVCEQPRAMGMRT